MNIYEYLSNNEYPGRGIIIGNAKSGEWVVAYFIMGRSENSRNRVFKKENDILFTFPYDESKVKDKSLIIYNAIRKYKNRLIVTNGDQTDTIYEYLSNGKTFKDALLTRTYEPDSPNYTPRISALLDIEDEVFQTSILRKKGEEVERAFFSYKKQNGKGRFLSTYKTNGDPLPSFEGEPKEIEIECDIDEFTQKLWSSLNQDNKISLYVSFINENGSFKEIVINGKEEL